MNLKEKYKPKKIKEIISNESNYKELIKDLKENKIQNFILCGTNGTGKTTFVDLYAKQNKYMIINVNLKKYNENIFQKTFIKKMIIIDEIDNNTKETDIKKLMDTVTKINKKNKVFILSSHNFTRQFKRKEFKLFRLQKPNIKKIDFNIRHILSKEKITYDEEDFSSNLKKIASESNNHFGQILQKISVFVGDSSKLSFNIEGLEMKKDKYFDTIYDILPNIYDKRNKEYLDHERLYYADSFIVENYIYENYPKTFNAIPKSKPKKQTKQLKNITSVINGIAEADTINANMNCNFQLNNYICAMNTINPIVKSEKPYSIPMFPSCVSKMKKANPVDNIKIMRDKDTRLFNYKSDDIELIKIIENIKKEDNVVEENKKKKTPKKEKKKKKIKKVKKVKKKEEPNEENLIKEDIDTKDNKKSYTVKELKQMCKDRKIKGYSKLKKNEMIELLKLNEEKEINNEPKKLTSLSREELIEILKKGNYKGTIDTNMTNIQLIGLIELLKLYK
jgi:hypothetical protein